jgi:uncharacterized surface protein with fasciclin (FAS1) repeats
LRTIQTGFLVNTSHDTARHPIRRAQQDWEVLIMKFAYAALLIAGLVTTSACSDSPATPSGIPNESPLATGTVPTIAEVATSRPEFTTLVAALQRANLVTPFTGSDQYTVFAPTNSAFDAAAVALLGPGKTGLDLVNGLPVNTLTSVLLYHASAGAQNAAAVLGGGGVVMLDGNRAAVTVVGGAAKIEGATIIATDVRARNGIVHIIDAVLLPPSLR